MKRMCACGRPHHARGMCNTHYAKWKMEFGRRSVEAEQAWSKAGITHANCGGELWERVYLGSMIQFCAQCKQMGHPARDTLKASSEGMAV